MAIDYSKWDKLELSDDSDIEVHPNVDKRSFIRWKQQDIHQKRAQRAQDIGNLELQIPMYQELNRRVDQLLNEVNDENLANFSYVQKYLSDTFDSNSKPQGVEPDAPTHNEMIEDLFLQLKQNLEKAGKDPSKGENLRSEMLEHRKKIDEVLFNHTEKLKTLKKERELEISSDNIHTGWDRSFLNKNESKPAPPSVVASPIPSSTETKAPISTAITPKPPTTAPTQSMAESEEQYDLENLHPDIIKYSQIPISHISDIKSFLKAHTHIIKPEFKDSLLMKSFDAQLEHNDTRAKQIIFLSTILQYIYDIIEFKKASHSAEIAIIVEQLMGKMFNGTRNPALEAFEAENERTYQHIRQRCEVISQESERGEEVEEIQLRSLDDDTVLVVNLPDENSSDFEEKERVKIFKAIPSAMQAALKTGELDEVNKVFSGMPVAEAEEILDMMNECGVIGVQAIIEDESQWKEIKQEYEAQGDGNKTSVVESKIQDLNIEEDNNTADIVD